MIVSFQEAYIIAALQAPCMNLIAALQWRVYIGQAGILVFACEAMQFPKLFI